MSSNSSGAVVLIVGGVAAVVGGGVGYVVRYFADKDVIEKLKKENGKLRKQLAAILETFKLHNEKMESVIKDIIKKKPRTKPETFQILISHGIDQMQAARMVEDLFANGQFWAAY